MTVLQRTDLTTSQKIQCAAAAVAGQHAHRPAPDCGFGAGALPRGEGVVGEYHKVWGAELYG